MIVTPVANRLALRIDPEITTGTSRAIVLIHTNYLSASPGKLPSVAGTNRRDSSRTCHNPVAVVAGAFRSNWAHTADGSTMGFVGACGVAVAAAAAHAGTEQVLVAEVRGGYESWKSYFVAGIGTSNTIAHGLRHFATPTGVHVLKLIPACAHHLCCLANFAQGLGQGVCAEKHALGRLKRRGGGSDNIVRCNMLIRGFAQLTVGCDNIVRCNMLIRDFAQLTVGCDNIVRCNMLLRDFAQLTVGCDNIVRWHMLLKEAMMIGDNIMRRSTLRAAYSARASHEADDTE